MLKLNHLVRFFVVLIAVLVFGFIPLMFATEGGFANAPDGGLATLLRSTLWIAIPLYIGLVLGQAFKAVFRLPDGAVSFAAILQSMRQARSSYAALFISPVAILILLQSGDGDVADAESIALSFQTGFFVDQLVETVRGRESKKSN